MTKRKLLRSRENKSAVLEGVWGSSKDSRSPWSFWVLAGCPRLDTLCHPAPPVPSLLGSWCLSWLAMLPVGMSQGCPVVGPEGCFGLWESCKASSPAIPLFRGPRPWRPNGWSVKWTRGRWVRGRFGGLRPHAVLLGASVFLFVVELRSALGEPVHPPPSVAARDPCISAR